MTTEETPLTVLCMAGYEKGAEFIRACKREGCRVLLLTVTSLRHAEWPVESIDEIFYLESFDDIDALVKGVSHLARAHRIDRIVALDDFDVEPAAALREHLRMAGMGSSTARYFRDKLAMRGRARDRDVLVPEFVHVLNDEAIRAYTERVPPPWVLKPRSEASTVGIALLDNAAMLWQRIEELGDRRSFHLLEQYVAGDVYHVDSIVSEGAVVFVEAHQYERPPLDVFHGGGLFVTRTLARDSLDRQALQALNQNVISALGLARGVTHIEFIKGRDDGRFYFLESAARVGGAYIVDVVEAATGINLWAEWARIEIAQGEREYHLPAHHSDYAGAIISLARQEHPDTSAYSDPEIVKRVAKRHHVGFVVASPEPDRVTELLQEYSGRIYEDFFASLPASSTPPD